MKKRYVIAGGTGFLGQSLIDHWAKENIEIVVLSRRNNQTRSANRFNMRWDAKTKGEWCGALEGSDVLINLTGKSVDCRYTKKNKREILRSRVDSTTILGECLVQLKDPPKIWINSSSATIYRHAEDRPMTERSGEIGDDFSMNVVKDWESTFFKKEIANVRKVAIRTSIVLGNHGGAFAPYKHLALVGFGGEQGDGNQMMSWIHIEDFNNAVDHIIEDTTLTGAVNVTSPNPIKNKEFMRELRVALNKSFGLGFPKWLIEIGVFFMRTESELLLKSRWVLPERLLSSGFSFQKGDISLALKNLCETKRN